MSAFYVGQRVRLARAVDGVSPAREKAEGVITSFTPTEAGHVFPNGEVNPNHCDCFVHWHGYHGTYSQHTNQLEPIVPPGMEERDESLRLWQPEGIAA